MAVEFHDNVNIKSLKLPTRAKNTIVIMFKVAEKLLGIMCEIEKLLWWRRKDEFCNLLSKVPFQVDASTIPIQQMKQLHNSGKTPQLCLLNVNMSEVTIFE